MLVDGERTVIEATCVIEYLPSTALAREAEPGQCQGNTPACWYIVFGTSDQPSRTLYFANGKTHALSGREISIEAIQMYESPDKYNYVATTFEFDCENVRSAFPAFTHRP
ncbi:hypothetical protein [Lysobacter fragariae]